jgi:hypothetical protein
MVRWLLALWLAGAVSGVGQNLLPDPSFEQPKPKDRWGLVFAKWGGWMYEGECEFRVSDIAHSGKHSLLIVGRNHPKIRASPSQFALEPGRYRVTAYVRGLDIGTGLWNQTTEFMFEEKYIPLRRNGTFGWTPLTYVGEVTKQREFGHPSFGLMAPGYLWVDDVSVLIGENPEAPLYLDNVRLERDTDMAKVLFKELWAFDLGGGSSPVMEGFTPLDVSKTYTKGRGYGWKNARFWRAFDALQPNPLYEDFICLDSPRCAPGSMRPSSGCAENAGSLSRRLVRAPLIKKCGALTRRRYSGMSYECFEN